MVVDGMVDLVFCHSPGIVQKDQAARNPEEIANLFANFFQEVYVNDE
jgi:hypothetical protein